MLGYNMFAYCMNNPVNMSDAEGNWPKWSTIVKKAKSVVKTTVKIAVTGAANILLVQMAETCIKNIISSKKEPDYKAVDKLLEERYPPEGDSIQLPVDTEGLLYNKDNRIYASKVIKEKLRKNSPRTVSDISSEIFAHQFCADMVEPFSVLSGIVPDKWDIYGRLSKADINDDEKRIEIFNKIEEVFEWE